MLFRQLIVGPVDGVSTVYPGVWQAKDLLTSDGSRAISCDDNVARITNSTRGNDARLVPIHVGDDLITELELNTDGLCVVHNDFVHLSSMSSILPPEVVGFQNPVLFPDQGPVGFEVLKLVALVDALLHELAAHAPVVPLLYNSSAVGEEVDDISVRSARWVGLDYGSLHAADLAFDRCRETAEATPYNDDFQLVGTHS